MPDIDLVLGLGNPGQEYAGTRHNLGYETLDELARRHRLGWKGRGGLALETLWRFAGGPVRLIKPLTFMNLSGDALRMSGASPDSVLVVCDDIHLPVGLIRIRAGGGSGGHRGLESVTEALGTREFARLRLGAGPAPPGALWSDYVLESFGDAEAESVSSMVSDAADAVELILSRGITPAQRRYNRRATPGENGGDGS
ncbi:MAG TPA: aminoacyl-tRNA hydrolase [Candidatus Eisenbacteria bacterium]|uniref:Peptidyl-tRNA hydrolase n=1 Tax=Eiseniibacteriota bacterium TaxID=2212470 RepID=A0A7V2F5B7_UNCEI|nr:aminoacyl-tRNA hydrolase [Candidatus Eisenbacteria bacterium]